MTEKERRKRFLAERREQLRRGVKIQSETYSEILLYLDQARKRILGELADQPSEFASWRLTALQDEIRRTIGLFERGTIASLLTGLDRSFQAGSDLVTAPIAAGGIEIAGLLPALDPRLLIALKSFQTDRIRDISTTVVNRINTEIGQAALGVQNPFDAAQKVAGHLNAPKARALTIVRTELGTAYAEAGQQRMTQAKAAGVAGLQKQWRRSGKLHPRITHDLADGQIVDVDEPFLVGGVKIMKPRDPELDPKDRINCGCSSLPHMAHWRVSTPGRKPFTAEEIATSPSARRMEEILAATPVLDRTITTGGVAELRSSLASTRWAQALERGDRLYGLSDEEALAIHAYTFKDGPAGASAVNAALRAGGAPPGSALASIVALQQAAIEKLPKHRGPVERRVERVPDGLAAAELGGEWSDAGFLSASSRASVFRRDFKRSRERLYLESLSGRDVSAFSTFDQAEVIFPPGTAFRVVGRAIAPNGRTRTWLEETG